MYHRVHQLAIYLTNVNPHRELFTALSHDQQS